MNVIDQDIIWNFIRGDLSSAEFEKWLYANNDFESFVGEELYLEVISTNYANKSATYLLKKKLEEFLRKHSPLECECLALSNLIVTDMGSEQENRIWETLEVAKEYGESRPWLALFKCKTCDEDWLIAQENENDVHCLQRLEKKTAEQIITKNEWPKLFETLAEIFEVGKNKK